MLLRAYRDGSDPKLPGGWLPTGDAGTISPDGRLHVYGRIAETINTGGEKVWPASIERVLAAHPKVAEVAVCGRPDPEWGERVVAFVVPADRSDPVGLDELRRCAKNTSRAGRRRARSCSSSLCPARRPERSLAGCCRDADIPGYRYSLSPPSGHPLLTQTVSRCTPSGSKAPAACW